MQAYRLHPYGTQRPQYVGLDAPAYLLAAGPLDPNNLPHPEWGGEGCEQTSPGGQRLTPAWPCLSFRVCEMEIRTTTPPGLTVRKSRGWPRPASPKVETHSGPGLCKCPQPQEAEGAGVV